MNESLSANRGGVETADTSLNILARLQFSFFCSQTAWYATFLLLGSLGGGGRMGCGAFMLCRGPKAYVVDVPCIVRDSSAGLGRYLIYAVLYF